MGVSNLVSLFGPTMMTVDGDPVSCSISPHHNMLIDHLPALSPLSSKQISFANTQYECNCISMMIKYYKWLFQVDEEEEKKEEVGQKGGANVI